MKKRLFLLPLMAISLIGCANATIKKEPEWTYLEEGDLLTVYIEASKFEYRLIYSSMRDTKFYAEQNGNITTVVVDWISATQNIHWTEYHSGVNVTYKFVTMEYLEQ